MNFLFLFCKEEILRLKWYTKKDIQTQFLMSHDSSSKMKTDRCPINITKLRVGSGLGMWQWQEIVVNSIWASIPHFGAWDCSPLWCWYQFNVESHGETRYLESNRHLYSLFFLWNSLWFYQTLTLTIIGSWYIAWFSVLAYSVINYKQDIMALQLFIRG